MKTVSSTCSEKPVLTINDKVIHKNKSHFNACGLKGKKEGYWFICLLKGKKTGQTLKYNIRSKKSSKKERDKRGENTIFLLQLSSLSQCSKIIPSLLGQIFLNGFEISTERTETLKM